MKTKILFLCLLAIVCLGFKCGGKESDSDGIFRGKLFINQTLKTPKGATLFSRTDINPALASPADAGLDTLIRIAFSRYGYTQGLSHSFYTIYLYPRSPLCQDPAFLVKTEDLFYDNGTWDKDPTVGRVSICVAGMMVDSFQYGMLVVDDIGLIAQVVRFEGEHLILFNNDKKRFEETMYHAEGTGHPMLTDEDGSRPGSLVAPSISEQSAVTITLTEDVKDARSDIFKKGARVCVLLSK